jgi:hypothetical protein
MDHFMIRSRITVYRQVISSGYIDAHAGPKWLSGMGMDVASVFATISLSALHCESHCIVQPNRMYEE